MRNPLGGAEWIASATLIAAMTMGLRHRAFVIRAIAYGAPLLARDEANAQTAADAATLEFLLALAGLGALVICALLLALFIWTGEIQ